MKISQAEYEAHRRYNEKNYEQISIRVPIGEKKKFKQFAQIAGVSLATYIRQSCYEKSYRQKEGITMQKPQQNKLPEVDLTTQIIDFNDCPVNKRVYGGLSGAKIGVVYRPAP